MRIVTVAMALGFSWSLIEARAQEEASPPKSLAQAKAEFAKVDEQLNRAYAETKQALPDYAFEELKKDQRQWIQIRDQRAATTVAYEDRQTPEGQEQQSATYWEALKYLTETRIEILRGWRGVGDPDSWTGRYIDGNGGLLEIVEEGNKIFFTLQVVRGPTYHTGAIAGEAKKNQTMARHSDATRPEAGKPADAGETWLTFVKRGRWLEIIGTNTMYYHGARAYFDGKFIRVAAFDEKQKEQVLKDASNPDWPATDAE